MYQRLSSSQFIPRSGSVRVLRHSPGSQGRDTEPGLSVSGAACRRGEGSAAGCGGGSREGAPRCRKTLKPGYGGRTATGGRSMGGFHLIHG